MVKKHNIQYLIGKILYGSIFIFFLPIGLFFWSSMLDKSVNLPILDLPLITILSFIFGGYLIIKGMLDLVIFGQGLPMNAYPPKKFVTKGVYALFPHPIYLGTGMISVALSFLFHSSSGLYIVTPVLIFMMLSLIYGYEKIAIKKLYGSKTQYYQPLFSIPRSSNKKVFRHHIIASLIAIFSMIYIYTLLFLFRINLNGSIGVMFLINIGVVIVSFKFLYLWNLLTILSERIANSRSDWVFFDGKFRIINHSIYSGIAGTVGVGIASLLLNNNIAAIVLVISVLFGASVFAQVLWGSYTLLRPFGFWGAIVGGLIGVFLINLFLNIPFSRIFLAGVLSAPFSQAIGRFRCLVQGCCHGTVTSKEFGIRVWQSQSRVVALSGMKGKYILNTQTISIIFNIFLGLLLWGMFASRYFSSTIIVGIYLVLTGIERFSEDAYRGEKQTRILWKLRENQWIALTALLIGIGITLIPAPLPFILEGKFNLAFFMTIFLGGLFSAFAMSMDFPKSTLRFSRLSG